MRTTGVIKRVDDLKRIVIPTAFISLFKDTKDIVGKPYEIFYEDDGTIILKPYKFKEE